MKKRSIFLAKAAFIAAVYAVLTYISAAFGLAFNVIQFRVSEALAVLPVFSAAAVPGLAVGCAAANIISSVNPLDAVVGSAATLLAGVLTFKLRKLTFRGFPLLSFIAPVVVNAVFIGAEIAFFSGERGRCAVFGLSALSVGAGEAAVVFTLGALLFSVIEKNHGVKALVED